MGQATPARPVAESTPLRARQVACSRAVQCSNVAVLIEPDENRILEGVDLRDGSPHRMKLGLVRAIDRLGERVVVRAADGVRQGSRLRSSDLRFSRALQHRTHSGREIVQFCRMPISGDGHCRVARVVNRGRRDVVCGRRARRTPDNVAPFVTRFASSTRERLGPGCSARHACSTTRWSL